MVWISTIWLTRLHIYWCKQMTGLDEMQLAIQACIPPGLFMGSTTLHGKQATLTYKRHQMPCKFCIELLRPAWVISELVWWLDIGHLARAFNLGPSDLLFNLSVAEACHSPPPFPWLNPTKKGDTLFYIIAPSPNVRKCTWKHSQLKCHGLMMLSVSCVSKSLMRRPGRHLGDPHAVSQAWVEVTPCWCMLVQSVVVHWPLQSSANVCSKCQTSPPPSSWHRTSDHLGSHQKSEEMCGRCCERSGSRITEENVTRTDEECLKSRVA